MSHLDEHGLQRVWGKITNLVAESDAKITDMKKDAVKSVLVYYALSNSDTTAPTSGWSQQSPTREEGYYIWQKITERYIDGHIVESNAVCISGPKGDTGERGPKGEDGAQGPKGDPGSYTAGDGITISNGVISASSSTIANIKTLWESSVEEV